MNEKLIYSPGRVPVELNDVSAQWSSENSGFYLVLQFFKLIIL